MFGKYSVSLQGFINLERGWWRLFLNLKFLPTPSDGKAFIFNDDYAKTRFYFRYKAFIKNIKGSRC